MLRFRNNQYYKYIKEWEEKNINKLKVIKQVNYAVRIGKLIKPKYCSSCNKKKRLYGHHIDYSKALEVIWLCGSCHKLLHNKLKSESSGH